MVGALLDLTRSQILAFRRHVGALDERLPRGRRSLRQAAWAGLQDSMPRAALLSIHARVEGTEPSTWGSTASRRQRTHGPVLVRILPSEGAPRSRRTRSQGKLELAASGFLKALK